MDAHPRCVVGPLVVKTSTDPDTARAAAQRRQVIAFAVTSLLLNWCAAAVARESISASEAARHVRRDRDGVRDGGGRVWFMPVQSGYDQAGGSVVWRRDEPLPFARFVGPSISAKGAAPKRDQLGLVGRREELPDLCGVQTRAV